MAQRALQKEDRENIKEFYRFFDKDNDGQITKDELKSVLKCVLLTDPSQADIDTYMKKFDADGNGTIEFEEFLNLTKSMPSKSLKELFQSIDTDNDHYISVEEMKSLLKALDKEQTDEKVEAFVRKADKDGDEKISYDEFVQLFASNQ